MLTIKGLVDRRRLASEKNADSRYAEKKAFLGRKKKSDFNDSAQMQGPDNLHVLALDLLRRK